MIGLFKWCLIDRGRLKEMKDRLAALEEASRKSRQQETALRHNLRLLDVLLNAIADPVFFQDAEGILQGCNLSFADKVVGRPRGKILGTPLAELRTSGGGPMPAALLGPIPKAGTDGAVAQVEGTLRCADDRDRVFIFSKAAIVEADGQVSGSVGVMLDITSRKRAEAEKEALIEELQEALTTVKTLRGLLPVCSFCKKIRDDQGYWQQLEAYIQAHSEAVFSHSVCEECARIHYPELKLGKG